MIVIDNLLMLCLLNRITRQLIMETQSAASICAMVSKGIGVSIVNPITALDYQYSDLCIRPLSFTIPFYGEFDHTISSPPHHNLCAILLM